MQFWVNPIALLLWLLLFLLHWCDVIDKEKEGKIEAATRLQQQQHLHSVGAVNFRSPRERSREREQRKHHTSRTDTQPHSDSKREREKEMRQCSEHKKRFYSDCDVGCDCDFWRPCTETELFISKLRARESEMGSNLKAAEESTAKRTKLRCTSLQ